MENQKIDSNKEFNNQGTKSINQKSKKSLIIILGIIFLLSLIFATFYVFGIGIFSINKEDKGDVTANIVVDEQNSGDVSYLSAEPFYSKKHGLKMYPPKGWIAQSDQYYGVEIMFIDQPQLHISDFSSLNAIIALTPIIKGDNMNNTENDLIDEFKNEMDQTIELGNKYNLTTDGINAVAYDWYLNSVDYGMVIAL